MWCTKSHRFNTFIRGMYLNLTHLTHSLNHCIPNDIIWSPLNTWCHPVIPTAQPKNDIVWQLLQPSNPILWDWAFLHCLFTRNNLLSPTAAKDHITAHYVYLPWSVCCSWYFCHVFQQIDEGSTSTQNGGFIHNAKLTSSSAHSRAFFKQSIKCYMCSLNIQSNSVYRSQE